MSRGLAFYETKDQTAEFPKVLSTFWCGEWQTNSKR